VWHWKGTNKSHSLLLAREWDELYFSDRPKFPKENLFLISAGGDLGG
jgi:hypothetical protein